MQDVDAPPAFHRRAHGVRNVRFAPDVRLPRHAIRGPAPDRDGAGFLGRGPVPVHGQDAGAFLRKPQHGCAAISHGHAGALASADDDRHFVL
ncbi:hypothetical protein D3C72_2185420 [compost metagenome]